MTILIGATGSGKSTQTLPFLVDSGILKSGLGKIACTQPRKVAAVSLADYVAAEWAATSVKRSASNAEESKRSTARPP